jgi:Ca2+-binding EF-hand superfamily protein
MPNRLTTLLAICWLGSIPVWGQPAGYIRSFPLLAALDSDRDGVISAAEIGGAAAALRTLDLNHDGKLSFQECGLGRASDAVLKLWDDTVKSLMAFDKNGDGKLEKEELPERMQGVFERGDADKDGVLTQSEIENLVEADYRRKNANTEQDPDWIFRSAMVSMRLVPVLGVLDANHDGQISAAELEGAAAALAALDKNHDGTLTEEEVRPDAVTGILARAFVAFDTNGDFRISMEEAAVPAAQSMRPVILAADLDKDGFVTVEELRAEITRRADLNHDGVVTREEMQQAMQSGVFGPSGAK